MTIKVYCTDYGSVIVPAELAATVLEEIPHQGYPDWKIDGEFARHIQPKYIPENKLFFEWANRQEKEQELKVRG